MDKMTAYAWSPKGRREILRDEPEAKDDWFICHKGKFIAQVTPENEIVIFGEGHCFSTYPDSLHTEIPFPAVQLTFDEEEMKADFRLNSRMKDAYELLKSNGLIK